MALYQKKEEMKHEETNQKEAPKTPKPSQSLSNPTSQQGEIFMQK